MKTNILTRIYTLVMSAVFATVATVGVAVLMASSGEYARTQFEAAAQQSTTLSRVQDLTGTKG